MKKVILLLFVLTLFYCASDDSKNGTLDGSEWLVDENDISGIFSLFPLSLDPEFVSVSNTDLTNNSLVGIVSSGSSVRIFPYAYVLRYEIINTSFNGRDYAFSYCPITKSAIAFQREGIFRASGYLLKDNMTPWDETTETIWSQMLGKGINGERINNVLQKIPVLETTWSTAKSAYPNARVLKFNTDFSRPQEPSDDNDDIELPFAEELIYGIVESNLYSVHFFKYDDFQNSKRKDIIIQGQKYIVYGNATKRVINAFKVSDFDSFQLLEDDEFPKVLKSNNVKYDILGNSTGGANLEKPQFAYVAAWFAWRDFFGGYSFYPNE
ncbi:DUF3179 domain-containing protein [Lacinutrix sp. C3R15]|uniref:DUF3179 domain-containing (seleno)protein n=1 Tax=Flavobacteriaceae TaxID=49546 RepID=UPI001C094B1F|nr:MULTISPECIES: DUF3179 domain-containing (seleno)protein [Flavobacteriaceae]MBU2939755.1 DUF3179 domain-containing protein [Lacinutrix sp. C3R15]MDO6623070.1 DUF3179 domain-containing (seleno)protein [Oceanihabitans sp. 1_MG-2023]